MKITDRHREALNAMEVHDFSKASQLLEEEAKAVDSWIVLNDLALCLAGEDRFDDSFRLLDRLKFSDPSNVFVIINRYYLEKVQEIKSMDSCDPADRIEYVEGEGPSSPLVSVIMPTYNRPRTIKESVESVLSQSMKEWELIVVNDGGDREVEKTLRDYGDERIRYVLARHRGTAGALNAGLSLARGKYVAYLDDDDIYYSDHLDSLFTFLESRPDLEAAFTLFYEARQTAYEKGGEVVSRKLRYSADIPFSAWRVQTQVPNRNPLMHRRELIDRIGGHSEALRYTEDWEFYLRLVTAGVLGGLDRITGEYRVREGKGQKTRRPKGQRNHCRNLIVYLHGMFPLTGKRFANTGQGNPQRLCSALARLAENDFEYIRSLELRKLLEEPYYSIFYRLGKDLVQEKRKKEARRMFRQALRVAPAEPKLFFRSVF
ncbi:MAG: glycosyltransferase family A protein [bacterium]